MGNIPSYEPEVEAIFMCRLQFLMGRVQSTLNEFIPLDDRHSVECMHLSKLSGRLFSNTGVFTLFSVPKDSGQLPSLKIVGSSVGNLQRHVWKVVNELDCGISHIAVFPLRDNAHDDAVELIKLRVADAWRKAIELTPGDIDELEQTTQQHLSTSLAKQHVLDRFRGKMKRLEKEMQISVTDDVSLHYCTFCDGLLPCAQYGIVVMCDGEENVSFVEWFDNKLYTMNDRLRSQFIRFVPFCVAVFKTSSKEFLEKLKAAMIKSPHRVK